MTAIVGYKSKGRGPGYRVGSSVAPVVLPPDIDAGMNFWFRKGVGLFTDVTKTVPSGVTDPVGCWDDQSANSVDISQAGANRAVLEADGAVHFDGANDSLDAIATPTLKPVTLFVLFKLDQVATFNPVIGGQNGLAISCNTTQLRLDKGGALVIGTSSQVLSAGVYYRVIVTYSATGVFAFTVNGVAAGGGTNDQVINAAAPGISAPGTGTFLDGIVKDWGSYNSVLSAPKIAQLDAYLASL